MAVPVEEALRRVLEAAALVPLATEAVPLRQALGRTLAEPATAAADVPGFANSAMDGFAVRSADVAAAAPGAPVELRMAGESRAGAPAAGAVTDGTAFRISTGAALPQGADAVVRVEDTEPAGDGRVRVVAAAPRGENVRHPGEDMRAGEAVIGAGTLLGAAEVGVLAAMGRPEVACARRPAVAVLATGDELVEPGTALRPGEIYNSNTFTLPAQVGAAGAVTALIEMVADDRAATVEAVGRGLEQDVVVLSGGVSVGEHDHVKAALAANGVQEHFWGVALRPGHPTWFGAFERDGRAPVIVFGLPGNPVSSMVTFHLFARPALAALQGRDPAERRTRATLTAPHRKRPGRLHAVRVRLRLTDAGWEATPTKDQGSHVLTSMLGAGALALIEAERGDVAAGERVEVVLL